MHVILRSSIIGERSGRPGDHFEVVDQAEADDLVNAGIAHYAPSADDGDNVTQSDGDTIEPPIATTDAVSVPAPEPKKPAPKGKAKAKE